ncbi:MetQ/NlpA family ABC transporter substrate-binding protein [Treponema sp.]|uniref:MetQ/NlpA family ABC transporter substrate-binding protein n=1 Tax=Treponema sp. TaxID=166 RepID=UPI003F09AEB2
MKKIATLAAAILAASLLNAQTKVKVGATPVPHAEMLSLIKDDLKEQGVDLQIIEMTDYVILNDALESGELDANFDQHIPYMESTNKEKGYHLVNAGGIHIEPIALYSKKFSKVSDLGKKAVVVIPNDPTNGGRALLLLQKAGLIELRKDAGITATPLDITKNPLKLKFKELDAASIPRVLSDVDAAVINGNYAIPAGLSATRDGLFVEGKDSPYVNIIAVKDGRQNEAGIKAIVKALQSDKIKKYISEKFKDGEVVAAF